MRRLLVLAVVLCCGPTVAQTISPVDPKIADAFRQGLIGGDDAALANLMIDNVTLNVTQQMGPSGEKRTSPEVKGRKAVIEQIDLVLAKLGRPTDAACFAPDGVSVVCQYKFGQPGRGMNSMVLFGDKKIAAVMLIYGGAAIQ